MNVVAPFLQLFFMFVYFLCYGHVDIVPQPDDYVDPFPDCERKNQEKAYRQSEQNHQRSRESVIQSATHFCSFRSSFHRNAASPVSLSIT